MTNVSSFGTWNELERKINPAPFMKMLRDSAPVYFDPDYKGYLVTRHSDFHEVIKDPMTFSNAKALYGEYRYQDIVEAILAREGHGSMAKILPMADPPEHTRVRAITNALLNNRRVQSILPFVEGLANELVDGFIADGHADMVSRFSSPLPVTTIGELLCLPKERWRDIIKWQVAFSACVGNYLESAEQAEKYGRDIAEMQNFLVGVLDERREVRGDDVLSDLLFNNPTDYEPLTQAEILGIATALIGGGHESTTTAITNLVHTLATSPHIVTALREAPNRKRAIAQFVEELLRMRPPVAAIPRIVTQDTHIGGVAIPAGAKVILAHCSVNRDEALFSERPEEFDLDRRNAARHVTFGSGIHVCMGAMIARAEIQTAATVLLERLDNMRLAEPGVSLSDYKLSIFDWNYVLQRLDVTFDAR